MDDLVTQLQTLVTEAQAALEAAQTAAAPPADSNDALVAALISTFTSAGYTVTAPTTEPELPSGE